jgi:hypothetical protein
MTIAGRIGGIPEVAGLTALLALGVHAGWTESPPKWGAVAALPPPCPSCDARHARLRGGPVMATEVQE